MNMELVPIKGIDPIAVFTCGGLDDVLAQIETKAKAFDPDATTAEGRKEIASVAYKIAQSKTYIDGIGKDLVADWKSKAKIVDATRKQARDFLDDLKADIRRPLTEWEDAQKERNENRQRLMMMAVESEHLRDENGPIDIETAKARIATLESIQIEDDGGDDFGEYRIGLEGAIESALSVLSAHIVAQEKYIAEQAELERLRKEIEERAKADRERQIAEEAAARAREEMRQAEEARHALLISQKKAAEDAAAKAEQSALERQALLVAQKEAAELAAKQAEQARAQMEEVMRLADEKAKSEPAEDEKIVADEVVSEGIDIGAINAIGGIDIGAINAIRKLGFSREDATLIVKAVKSGKVYGLRMSYQ